MIIDKNTGLVLDCFMDKGIRFPFIVGVSAGACNGLSYMSGQRGRAKASNIDLMDEYQYIGLRYLMTQGCIMDYKLLFEEKSSAERVMSIVRASRKKEGKFIVIRPIKPVEVGRMEKDTAKLTALYQEGYELAASLLGF